ncbi:MAG: hypothetical protein HYW70_01755 [Candidatus Nealsonbacteria bacterium]|nr:hypothetical protein [Candidatus Nealsonbacteria bacterium]
MSERDGRSDKPQGLEELTILLKMVVIVVVVAALLFIADFFIIRATKVFGGIAMGLITIIALVLLVLYLFKQWDKFQDAKRR